MYYYIVDTSNIPNREFNKAQQAFHSALSEYKINGEVVRVTGARSAKQLVETAFFHQATTIVAVGCDETLEEIINLVGERPVIIGYVPLKRTELAEILGIESIADACKNLALRRIAEVDLGFANGNLFLSKLSFGVNLNRRKKDYLGLHILKNFLNRPNFEITFNADEKIICRTNIVGGVIMNCSHCSGSPMDGLLDVVLLPNLSRMEIFRHRLAILSGEYQNIPRASILHLETIDITGPQGTEIIFGSKVIAQVPVRIEIRPRALKLIVGRTRKFG